MRRIGTLVLVLLCLAVPLAPAADATPEAGTLEMTGVLLYTRSGGTSQVGFYPAPCVHSRTPNDTSTGEITDAAGWTCNSGDFWLGGTAPSGGSFTLDGYVSTSRRWYTLRFSLLDLFVQVGPNVATGTISEGGRTGPAVFTFVSTPHADANKSSFVGTLQYQLS